MCSNRIVHQGPLALSALALSLLAACNGPVRVPVQPQPQAPAYPILVTPLGQLVLDQRRPGIGAQFAPLPLGTPAAGPSAAEALLNRLLSPPKR